MSSDAPETPRSETDSDTPNAATTDAVAGTEAETEAAADAATAAPESEAVTDAGTEQTAGEESSATSEGEAVATKPPEAAVAPATEPAPEVAAVSTENAVSEELNASPAADGVPSDAPGVDSVEDIVAAANADAPQDVDQPSAATVSPDAAVEAALNEATEGRARPKLNPTEKGGAKAVPTYSGGGEDGGPRGPVEVPKDADIEADMEAEIAAAMSTESNAAPTPPTTTDGEQEEQGTGPEIATVEQYPTEDQLEEGLRMKGKVQKIHGEDVFIDLGYRSPAIAQLRQFGKKTPTEGQELEVIVSRYSADDGLIQVNLPRGPRKVSGDWSAVSKGQVVDVMVSKTNKGGLEVEVGNLRGFMPASQAALGYTEDLEQFVGQKLRCVVTEVNPRRRNLIVSHRAFLMIEREEAESMIWTKLEEGQTFEGTVNTIKEYGAFVDIGGVDGFLHISDVSWNRIRHPSDVISQGQQISVKVISLDREKKRIGLGMKQLTQNPWSNIEDKYPKDATVNGKVTKVTDFGAFVELEPSVEGLCHISQLAHRRVHKVTEVVRVGESYDFKITEVIPSKKRISLSIKALIDAPVRTDNRRRPSEELPEAEKYERKRKGPLKGGTGPEEGGGGLFGNPTDFGS